ncbi:MAG: PAS domain S-box protein, partial [Acidobacteria bacterium]|nr:PAS domain S-box protein [Acidobacteriota bacterium]
ERYRGLIEVSPGAVALYDRALHISEWNASAEKLYGFTKTEVLESLLPTVPHDREAELQRFLERVEKGTPVLDVETLRRNKAGEVLEVQLSLLPFPDADVARGLSPRLYFLEVTSDIRERVRMRQQMLEIEKLTSMGKMAAGTAHHLNTPLAAMLLRLQMMHGRCHNQPCTPDLERLESGLHFCQNFVQRLLEFGRRAPMEKRPEEVARSIQSIVSFLAPSILAKRAQLTLDVQESSGEQVLADPNQLEALFSALFSNALDAIPAEGSICVRCHRLSPDWLEIMIADNGCGISDADLPHVFGPFFTTKAAGKGTGLGLAIARNIVEEHGGKIHLQSKLQGGTTVFVQLPIYDRSAHEARHP